MTDEHVPAAGADSDSEAYLAHLVDQPLGTRLRGYIKLSGPGWLQSAITLGGGSLASSLYLGVLAGFSLLWLQPIAMILGIIMLSAIGYVTLSTQERPFRAINEHVNPVMGWGWAWAVAAANVVWCLPQYSLANGVLTQNLAPGLLGPDGSLLVWAAEQWGANSWMGQNANKLLIVSVICVVSIFITFSYDRGGRGLKIYETILKLMVGLIVLCFFGVVVVMSVKGNLDFAAILAGLVPDFSKFTEPADTFLPFLDAIGESGEVHREFWSSQIVARQRDVMIAAAATAVGINMTFLYPYSLLRKKWTRAHRGLAIFDLSTGMFIPYILATGCVVIAAGSQFHTKIDDGFQFSETGAAAVVVPKKFTKDYSKLQSAWATEFGEAEDGEAATMDLAEQQLAAMLVSRDSGDLSQSLAQLTGKFTADIVFGLGVLAMTLSTISILMLISGFVICEILGLPDRGVAHKAGMLLAGIGGAAGPFVWGQASAYLAVPTSVFGFILLPFAYITFFLLMNQRKLLGEDVPRGMKRVGWNMLMGLAATTASIGAVYMIWVKTAWTGIAIVGAFILLALCVQCNRYNEARRAD